MASSFRCIIMGAAGRDFHDFQTFFRRYPQFHVEAFTAAQIPFIETRVFPQSLAGPDYTSDIPIFPEERLPELIRSRDIDFVFLAYSDLSHLDVMHKASLVQSYGAAFALLGPHQTQLSASKPVISITATRTGAGKSPLAQWLARYLVENGHRAGVIRHPMPYGDLSQQIVQRFATYEDLDRYDCTVEEREEFEPYIEQGLVIFAGVDYEKILRFAEQEADLILWDGGNNDYSFIKPDLSMVVVDALRSGHETAFYPGETNFRMADILVLNKVSQAKAEDVQAIRRRANELNPQAVIIESDLEIDADNPQAIIGKRVLVVEDGPTLTHGGMTYGAGVLAAKKFGAAELIDPRGAAVGTVAEVFQKFPGLGAVLPALGYSHEQCNDLAETIHASGVELVVDASPAGLGRALHLRIPTVRVTYRFQQTQGPPLEQLLQDFLRDALNEKP